MKFREHRGGIKESMETMVEVHSWVEFVKHIDSVLGNYIDITTLKIEPYSNTPDERIGWNKTCIVMAVWKGDTTPHPIGFTDCLEEEIK